MVDNAGTENPLKALTAQGQAVWLDYIRRDMLTSGELARLVEKDGVTGVTSNPAIFEKAIAGSDLYDDSIREYERSHPGAPIEELYEELAVTDIRLAADALWGVYVATEGADGFVSLEVSPRLADDTQTTIDRAHHLRQRVDRPNVMIKVPATSAGVVAVEQLIADGVHINVTLMFSLADYEAVAQAYLSGVRRAANPSQVASVASFFVSRVDSKVDAALEQIATSEALALRGQVAIANSKLAYRRFEQLFHGDEFSVLHNLGVRPQRPLWASTSTKNPSYRDVLYVEDLIGPETVNTIPPKTLDAFRDHGLVRRTVDEGVDAAAEVLEQLSALGIDLAQITADLQREGVEKFVKPFDSLLDALEHQRKVLIEDQADPSSIMGN